MRQFKITKDYSLSFPAANGETVTQGHTDYCNSNGHAVPAGSETCSRCGAVVDSVRSREATHSHMVRLTKGSSHMIVTTMSGDAVKWGDVVTAVSDGRHFDFIDAVNAREVLVRRMDTNAEVILPASVFGLSVLTDEDVRDQTL